MDLSANLHSQKVEVKEGIRENGVLGKTGSNTLCGSYLTKLPDFLVVKIV